MSSQLQSKSISKSLSNIIIALRVIWGLVIFLVLFSFLGYAYNSIKTLDNETDYFINLFNRRISQIEYMMDRADSFSAFPWKTLKVDRNGIVTKSSKSFLGGVNISNSSLFISMKSLKSDMALIMLYPDIVDSILRVHVIKSYNGEFKIVTIDPDEFFTSIEMVDPDKDHFSHSHLDFMVVNSNRICVYGSKLNCIGDHVEKGFVTYRHGQVLLALTHKLDVLAEDFELVTYHDITVETLFYSVVFLLILIFSIVLYIRMKSMESELLTLNSEQEQFNSIVDEISNVNLDENLELTSRLDRTINYYESFLGRFNQGGFKILENQKSVMVVNELVNHILRLIKQSQIDARKLENSESKYRKFFETANDAIFVLQNRKIINCNKKAEEFLGETRENIIGKETGHFVADSFFYGKNPREEIDRIYDELQKGKPQLFNWAFRRHDGSILRTEISADMLMIDGEPFTIVFARDISDRVKLEEERAKSQRIESLGILSGGIAHDFNNLLFGLFSHIELAKKSLDPDSKAQINLEKALLSYEQAKKLTTQLQTFSKGEITKRENVDPRSLLVTNVEFALSGSNISYSVEIEDELGSINADEGQLSQVFSNILINAKQAMLSGGNVNIKANRVFVDKDNICSLDEGRYIKIEISDNGPGIPEDVRSKIFDPFFTSKKEGSGLGLAVSYSIVSKHGGCILVDSEVGKGTTFKILLPVITESKAKVDIPIAPEMSHELNGTVLLMDDEPFIREVLEDYLSELGLEVFVSSNGEGAIDLYRNNIDKIDLVILDLTVQGGMGGIETLRVLKDIDPSVKAIASSGYAEQSVVDLREHHGFVDFLIKPYKLENLKTMVVDLLSEASKK